MKRQLRFVLSNTYGHPNIGDEAILRSMSSELHEYFGNCDLAVLTLFPNLTTSQQRRVRSVYSGPIRGTRATVQEIRNADLLILGGGGIIQDATSLGNLLFHLSRAYLAYLLRTPFMTYGIGVGPLENPISRELAKRILTRAKLISVRDEISAKILASIGVPPQHVFVTADPVMNLKPECLDPENAYSAEITRYKNAGKAVVGISLRTSSLADPLLEPGRLIENLSVALHRLSEQLDYHIVFYSMHPQQDDILYAELSRKLKGASEMTFVRGQTDPQVMISLVGLSDLFIGMRLHSLIFAARSSIPMIGLSYAPKVTGFMQMIDQAERVISPNNWEPEHIYTLAINVWKKRTSISNTISSHVDELQRQAARNSNYVEQVLRESS